MDSRLQIHRLILFGLLLATGCATEKPSLTVLAPIQKQFNDNIDSYRGQLTKTQLLMFASSPTERIAVDNSEIWIYTYRISGTTTTLKTTTGRGGLLDPYKTVETTSAPDQYTLEVKFQFDNGSIVKSVYSRGHIYVCDTPFHHYGMAGGKLVDTDSSVPSEAWERMKRVRNSVTK